MNSYFINSPALWAFHPPTGGAGKGKGPPDKGGGGGRGPTPFNGGGGGGGPEPGGGGGGGGPIPGGGGGGGGPIPGGGGGGGGGGPMPGGSGGGGGPMLEGRGGGGGGGCTSAGPLIGNGGGGGGGFVSVEPNFDDESGTVRGTGVGIDDASETSVLPCFSVVTGTDICFVGDVDWGVPLSDRDDDFRFVWFSDFPFKISPLKSLCLLFISLSKGLSELSSLASEFSFKRLERIDLALSTGLGFVGEPFVRLISGKLLVFSWTSGLFFGLELKDSFLEGGIEPFSFVGDPNSKIVLLVKDWNQFVAVVTHWLLKYNQVR